MMLHLPQILVVIGVTEAVEGQQQEFRVKYLKLMLKFMGFKELASIKFTITLRSISRQFNKLLAQELILQSQFLAICSPPFNEASSLRSDRHSDASYLLKLLHYQILTQLLIISFSDKPIIQRNIHTIRFLANIVQHAR